jgi:major membrane immunogen (membrane-anchored lipoprotein)
MADILVQNAIKQLAASVAATGPKLDYKAALGVTLKSFLTTLITNNSATGGPYYIDPAAATGTGILCDLSCSCKVSACACNYSGSGSNSTYNSIEGSASNAWAKNVVLTGGKITKSLTDIVSAFTELDATLASLYALSDQTRIDIYVEYKALESGFSGNADVLLNWYNIGAVEEVAGARLSNVNYIKVCGTDWTHGEGGTCTWTVPAEATQAKFQVWGAGLGTNPGCCCGGAPFGLTGGYAETMINVTAGEQYTVCAGCSCKVYYCSNSFPGYSCRSGVTGPGICCLAAGGAGGCTQGNCNNMNLVRCEVGSGGACYRYQSLYCTNGGACWCSNNEYCYDNSCETCGVVASYPSCCGDMTQSCSCVTADAYCIDGKDGPTRQHRGIIGGGCLDQSNYGWHVRPPVIDSDTGLAYDCTLGCSQMTFTSGTCCGGCNGKDWTYHPGHGGAATHVMSQSNDHKGDTGRGGMVQISWI